MKLPLPDKSKDIRILYSILIGNRPHVLTVVLVGHLLVEHLLDQIIVAKIKHRKGLLKSRFSQKLNALRTTWLPLNIYKNLKILNVLRNDLAHNLFIGKYEPIYFGPKREKIVVKVPKRASGSYYPRKLVEFILYEMANNNSHTLHIPVSTNLKRLFHSRNLKRG